MAKKAFSVERYTEIKQALEAIDKRLNILEEILQLEILNKQIKVLEEEIILLHTEVKVLEKSLK